MIIKPKYDMTFRAAKSGDKRRMLRNVLLEIDPEELAGIDKADYDVVDAEKPGEVMPEPAPKKKK